MLWDVLDSTRDLSRVHDIASILVRYGFGDVVRRLGFGTALERAGKVLHWKEAKSFAHMEPPQRVCQAMQELGPTYVKLGQILASRVDLFSPEWIVEFEKLQDQANLVPFDVIRKQLEEDFGAAPEKIFTEFNSEPIAAASMAQVYLARLEDGTAVVVKVRRPGIQKVVEADLRLLNRLTELIESEMPEMRRYRPREIVRQFTLSLRNELDFASECRNAERIAKNFANDENIIVPKVYWQWTSERVNVQEYIEGISGRDLKTVDETGLDRKILAQRGANAVLKMILKNGYFHADPHQGNIFYLPNNRIAFIDFGMVGRLSAERRLQVVRLLHGMVDQQADNVVDILLDWAGDIDVQTDVLESEIEIFLDQYHGVPLKELNLGKMMTDLTVLIRDHELSLPPDLSLLIKAFISLEGMGRQLDPDFDMVAEATPFISQVMLARYAPDALMKEGWQAVVSAIDTLTGLPKDFRHLLRFARRGKLQVHVDVTRLTEFGNKLDSAANRIAVGNIIAALIIGSSIVMTVEGGPTLFGLPLFGMIGFIGASMGAVWLLLSVWRSKKN